MQKIDKQEQRIFWKKLTPLFFPIAFQQLMQSLVSTSDAVMMGLIDQSSLSAVSLATQITFVSTLFIWGLTGGGNILAAQYWGRRSIDDVEQVFAIMVRPSAVVGTLFSVAALFAPGLLMRIFTTDPLLIRLGSEYLRAVSLSYVLNCVNQCYLCILRNTGHAFLASAISSTGVVVNILLNAVLIFGLMGFPALGITGAAIATVLTRILEMVWILFETAKPGRVKLRTTYLFGKCDLSRDYWSHSIILTANHLAWGLGITMGSVILGRLGSDAVAANSIAVVAKNLINCFCNGIANGGAILVGNELGAGQLAQAKRYGDRVVKLALISGMISCAVLVALTPAISQLAELTPLAEEYLKFMIIVCGINMIGMANNSAINAGIFSAGGDTRFGLICDTIVLWGIVVPLGLLAAFIWKLPIYVIYCIIYSDEIIKLPAVWHHYRKYLWVRDLTRKREEVL